MSIRFLKALLIVIGFVVIWLGLNVSLGGIMTLGWQGPNDFVTVSNSNAFAVQDNHVRFIAGVWTGLGIFMVAGAFFLERLSVALRVLMALVFIGGLARLTAADPVLLLSSNIAPSLFMELVIFPLMGVWIYRATRA